MRRGRKERTPSPVEEEEEEEEEEERVEDQGSEEEEEHVEGDEEEAEEGAAGGERVVWLCGPSQLSRRPIPLTRRLMIRPLEPK